MRVAGGGGVVGVATEKKEESGSPYLSVWGSSVNKTMGECKHGGQWVKS